MSDLPKVGVVVLNYQTYNDTIECVQSLKKQTYENKEIVIVENGSGNESEKVLKEKYHNEPNITIIVSKENLGFAKGNNLGIIYLREKLFCDYVFVLNSDTIVPDGVFSEIIKIPCGDIGAISPKVVDEKGVSLEPSENSNDIYKRIRYSRKIYYLGRILSLPIINNIYSYYCSKKKIEESDGATNKVYGKYVLQGCSYFLTPTFFKYYRGLYPNTFLYWEEANLLVYLEKVGLHSVLTDTPPIVHKINRSAQNYMRDNNKSKIKLSNQSYHNSKKMYKMKYEEIIEKYK